ncbi:MAG: TonB family protein [Candidatus Hydrogenedentes bacterium]|nr:TonB family protein [Candidatus Hydrogenedentota bacterium]
MMPRIILFGCALWVSMMACAQQSSAPRTAIAPVYPALAAQGHISGRVGVEVTLDERGAVTSAALLDGHPLLAGSALWAAERWVFERGDAGRRVRLSFVFVLLPTKADVNELATVFRPPHEVESKARLPQPVINYGAPKQSRPGGSEGGRK